MQSSPLPTTAQLKIRQGSTKSSKQKGKKPACHWSNCFLCILVYQKLDPTSKNLPVYNRGPTLFSEHFCAEFFKVFFYEHFLLHKNSEFLKIRPPVVQSDKSSCFWYPCFGSTRRKNEKKSGEKNNISMTLKTGSIFPKCILLLT